MASAAEIEGRNLLLPVDDAEDCERCLQWVLDNVYRAGDVIHLFHVVTHNTARSLECFSTPQEDLPPERHHQEMLVEHAHNMIQERFVRLIDRVRGLYHVAIVRGIGGDCDSIGQSICVKADELRATLIAMSAHNKGRLMRFLVGSVTQYCVRTSHVTVAVV